MRLTWRTAVAVLLSICLTAQPLQSVLAQEATPTSEPPPTETTSPAAIASPVPTEIASATPSGAVDATGAATEPATIDPIVSEAPVPSGLATSLAPDLSVPELQANAAEGDVSLESAASESNWTGPAWHYGPSCTVSLEGQSGTQSYWTKAYCLSHVEGEVVAFILTATAQSTDSTSYPQVANCHIPSSPWYTDCPVNHPAYRLWDSDFYIPDTTDFSWCMDTYIGGPFDEWCNGHDYPAPHHQAGGIWLMPPMTHFPNPSDNAFVIWVLNGPKVSSATITIQYILAGDTDTRLNYETAVCPCDAPIDTRDPGISTLSGTQGWVGDPINSRNGEFSHSVVDLKIDTPAGPLQFDRHYESLFTDVYTGTLGYGWTHNQDIHVLLPEMPGGQEGILWFKGPGGNQYWFDEIHEGVFVPSPGVTADFASVSSGGTVAYTIEDSTHSTYAFDGQGRIVTWRDSLDRGFDYIYSITSGLLSLISEPISGHSLSFDYDPDVPGRLVAVSDDTGRSVSYRYHPFTGDLISVTDVSGQVWTYNYDGAPHLLTRVFDPDDGATPHLRVAYDAFGRAQQEWNGLGNLILDIEYDEDGSAAVTDVFSQTQYFTHTQGQLTSVVKPLGVSVQTVYDEDSRKPAEFTDANGSQVELTWMGNNANTNLTRVTNDLDQSVQFSYGDFNNPTAIIDARGFTTTLGYSGTLLTSQTDALDQTSLFTYTDGSGSEPGGLLRTAQDALGQTTVYTYNSAGQLITVADPVGLARSFTYDSLGRLATETGADQLTTKYEYNAAGQVVTTTVNVLAGQGQNHQNLYNLVTVNAYDAVGRLVRTTDTLGRSDWTCYDNANRVVKTVQNASGGVPCDGNYSPGSDSAYDRITVYTYDEAGNLIATTDPAGRITRTYYDALNRPTVSVQNLSGQAVEVTTPPDYDPAYPDQNLRTTTTYDAAGHVLSAADNVGTLMQLCYDVLGRAVKSVQNATVADPCGSYTVSGSADQDLTSQTVYDANGNVIASIDTQGRITRTYYDALNRPEVVVSNLTGQAIEVSDANARRRTTRRTRTRTWRPGPSTGCGRARVPHPGSSHPGRAPGPASTASGG